MDANKVRITAETLNALMEAFEMTYMDLVDGVEVDEDAREKGAYAFYGLRDLLGILTKELEEMAKAEECRTTGVRSLLGRAVRIR